MKLRLVEPTIEYKEKVLDYINEFITYKSEIHGSSGLENYLDSYSEWLKLLDQDKTRSIEESRVPALTYFLVNEENNIIGMINLRLRLNEYLKKEGGHIGYAIRPTERRKGYNKINLYLALEIYNKLNIKEVYLDCNTYNVGSRRTMESLGATYVLTGTNHNNLPFYRYKIDVPSTIKKYKYLIN